MFQLICVLLWKVFEGFYVAQALIQMHAKMCINTNLSPGIIKGKKTHLCCTESPGLCKCASMTHLRYIINSARSGETINIDKKRRNQKNDPIIAKNINLYWKFA